MSKVFFSWQDDRPGETGRHLIHGALEDAVKAILAEAEIEVADREIDVDSDTRGVAGTPPIFDTILKKIGDADAFVADLTFVGERADGRRTPNPNVMFEYGYAFQVITWQGLIGVMNTFYGDPANGDPAKFALPFDLCHMRRPISYSCGENADAKTIKSERKMLAAQFKSAIELILKQSAPAPIPRKEYVSFDPVDRAWFRKDGESIGIVHDSRPPQKEGSSVQLARASVMWLRVMPKFEPEKTILNTDLRAALNPDKRVVWPLNRSNMNVRPFGIHGPDGYGLGINETSGVTHSVVYAFNCGEVCSADAESIREGDNTISLHEDFYRRALNEFSALLRRVGVEGPYRWAAGLEGVKGRVLRPADRSFDSSPVESVRNSVVCQGDFSGDPNEALSALEPFFVEVFDLFQLKRS